MKCLLDFLSRVNIQFWVVIYTTRISWGSSVVSEKIVVSDGARESAKTPHISALESITSALNWSSWVHVLFWLDWSWWCWRTYTTSNMNMVDSLSQSILPVLVFLLNESFIWLIRKLITMSCYLWETYRHWRNDFLVWIHHRLNQNRTRVPRTLPILDLILD